VQDYLSLYLWRVLRHPLTGIVEDVTDIVLNLKKIKFKAGDHTGTLYTGRPDLGLICLLTAALAPEARREKVVRHDFIAPEAVERLLGNVAARFSRKPLNPTSFLYQGFGLSIICEKSYACIFVPVWQTESELVVNTELSTGSPHSRR
jgi:hypothetical protein